MSGLYRIELVWVIGYRGGAVDFAISGEAINTIDNLLHAKFDEIV